jgi:hypothetical protein
MKRIHATVLCLGLIALVACAPTYRDNLEQRLAGKSRVERRAILAEECGKEVHAGLAAKPEKARTFAELKAACEEMTGRPAAQ